MQSNPDVVKFAGIASAGGWRIEMKRLLKTFWHYIDGINGLVFILYTIFILSSQAILDEPYAISGVTVKVLLYAVMAVIICPVLLKWLSRFCITCCEERKGSPLLVKLGLFLLTLGALLLHFWAYYPGGFSVDSIAQFEQAVTNRYNDWHPVVHTLLAFKLPLLLTNGSAAGTTLFQIFCFSLVIAYSLYVIWEYTNLKYVILSVCFVFLNPQTFHVAMYVWKDVALAIGVLLLLTYALRIYATKGEWLKKPLHLVLFVLATVLTTLVRHNAVLFTAPLVFAVLFYSTPKRSIILCLSIAVLLAVVKYPLYTVLEVEKPGARQVETLGLPVNIIGAAVTFSPEQVDGRTLQFAYEIAPEQVWAEKYNYGSYNQVKFDPATDNNVIEEYGAAKVLYMMAKCFKTATLTSMKSLIKLTDSIYGILHPTMTIFVPEIAENELGIALSGSSAIRQVLQSYGDFVAKNLPFLFDLGVLHLILIAAILSKLRLEKLSDWKMLLFLLPVFTYNYGTSILLTEHWDALRFFYYVGVSLPTMLVFVYGKGLERKVEESV